MRTFKGRNIDRLIEKLLYGEALEEEEQLLKEWMDLSPFHQSVFQEKVREFVESSKDQYKEAFGGEQGWKTFKKSRSSPIFSIKKVSVWMSVAAVVMLAFMIGRIWPFSMGTERDQEFYVYAPKGEKAQVELPDGSRVTLNGETTLTWMGREGGVRRVALNGEGFFEVKADIEHPFTVAVDTLLFTVTGTKFNIYGYKEEPVVSTLIEGKIKVGMAKKGQEMVLTPGQICKVEKRNAPFELLEGSIHNYIGWKNDCLIFKNEPFAQVARKIERWYGVKVLWKGEGMENLRFTGTFQSKSLHRVLRTLCRVGNLNYYTYGTTITIKSKEGLHPLPN